MLAYRHSRERGVADGVGSLPLPSPLRRRASGVAPPHKDPRARARALSLVELIKCRWGSGSCFVPEGEQRLVDKLCFPC